MKAFMTVAVLGLGVLSGCGAGKELEQARAEVGALKGQAQALRTENTALKGRAGELERQLAQVRQERDTLKAAAQKASQASTAPKAGTPTKTSTATKPAPAQRAARTVHK